MLQILKSLVELRHGSALLSICHAIAIHELFDLACSGVPGTIG